MGSRFLAGAGMGLVASVAAVGALSVAVGLPEDRQADTPGAAPADTTAPADVAIDQPPPRTKAGMEGGAADAEAEQGSPRAEAPRPESGSARDASAPADRPEPPAPARRPSEESPVTVTDTAPLDAPEAGRNENVAGGDTASAGLPDIAGQSATLAVPAAPGSTGRIAVTTDAPVLSPPSAEGPSVPAAEPGPRIATQPAQPPSPALPEDRSGLVEDDAGPDGAGGRDVAVAAGAGNGNEDAPPEPKSTMPETSSSRSQNADGAGPAAEPSPAGDAAAAAAEPGLAVSRDGEPNAAVLPDADEDRPSIGSPADTLADREDAVPVLRAGETAPEEESRSAAEPPMVRYAADPVPVGAGPRMSIVLIDEGTGPLGPQALESVPFPVSFALDPGSPDVAERMVAYRERGFEVLALAGLPDGADARDAEVALEAALATVPEAVAVLEAPDGTGFAKGAVSDQVARILRDSGHGLLTLGDGLSAVTAQAAREGVPAARIYRDLGGDERDMQDVQRRLLDQAALRARGDGDAILLGRLDADTVSEILLWSMEDRASGITLVPVSQILSGKD